MSLPNIIAIETSGRAGSVAVGTGDTILAIREMPPTQRHAVELMPTIRDLTADQGWKPADIHEIYLSLGPGSFTGLRIALAAARAIAQATGCKLVGVPSLDVIAQNAPPEFPIVVPILDAKRAQVFAARYERRGTALEKTVDAALVDPAAFLRDAAALGPVCILGEGIDYHRPALASVAGITELPKSLWVGRAQVVYRLGLEKSRQGDYADPRSLLPIYIRLPEAEEVWRKKHGLSI